MHLVYYPSTLILEADPLSHIDVDFDIPTKVSFTDNAEFLVLTSFATTLVEPSFLPQVSKSYFDTSDLEVIHYYKAIGLTGLALA